MSISGGGVEANSGPAINPSALLDLLAAPEGTQKRIAAFQQAKTEAEQALADLRLGQGVQAAHAAAQAALAEAEAIKAKAQEAQQAAERFLADAQQNARQIIAEAQAKAKSIADDLEQAKADHQANVAETAAQMADQQREIDLAARISATEKAKALAAQQAADAAHEEAKRLQDIARAAEDDLKTKAAKVQQALAQLATG